MDVVVGKDVSLGELHFGSAALDDSRRSRRLVKVAHRIMGQERGV